MVMFSTEKKKEIIHKVICGLVPGKLGIVRQTIKTEIKQFDLTDKQTVTIEGLIFKKLYKLPLKWQTNHFYSQIYSPHPNVFPFELIGAFGEQNYTCYFTALYFNELTLQVPRTIYIAIPKKAKDRKSASQYIDLDFEVVRDVFMKKPRESAVSFIFADTQFVLVERDVIHSIGLTKRELIQNNRKIFFQMTDVERTLIDCTIAPHRAGGINAVINAFKLAGARLDLGKLYFYYSAQHFLYPYWQRVGFLLERSGISQLAQKWNVLFGEEKRPFFLMHEYRISWKLDKFWQLYYPSVID